MNNRIASTITRAGTRSFRQSRIMAGFDDRAVVITFLIYLAALVSCGKYDLPASIALGAFPLFLLVAGRLPAVSVITRVLLVSPFVVLVAAGNLYLDRHQAMVLGGVVVTGGMISALVIVVKGVLSILAVVILGYLISFYHVCLALRGLHVPKPFIMQLILLYRYLFVLGEEAVHMVKARDLRSFGRKGKEVRVTVHMLGTLLMRTLERAEKIYGAMDARGFGGVLPAMTARTWRVRDGMLVVGCAVVFAVIRLMV